MSRSHRKPYFREENKKPKKKAANKTVRNLSDGAHYRKLYDSYKIDDFGWLTKNSKLERR